MELTDFLAQLGIATVKQLCSELFQYVKTKPSRVIFDQTLSNMLLIHGAQIHSDKIINFLATEGYIELTDSYVQATEKLVISAQKYGFFKIGENTRVGTDSSYMTTGYGASAQGSGNARIDFNDKGITFSV